MCPKQLHVDAQVLQSQIEYYRQRVTDYDDAFLRKGRWDHGRNNNEAWFRELSQVEDELKGLGPLGETLDIACGTGLWTERLIRMATRVTAIDSSAEMLAACSKRVGGQENVILRQEDIFAWEPREAFDTVFFGFWLSHVPRRDVNWFWNFVAGLLKPGGRSFFVDHRPDPDAFEFGRSVDAGGEIVSRTVPDGRTYQLIKCFYTVGEIRGDIARANSFEAVRVAATAKYFIYGRGAKHARANSDPLS
jgi:SAM-dependent methyltransferase